MVSNTGMHIHDLDISQKARRPTAISGALQAIRNEGSCPSPPVQGPGGFSLRIASDRETRERAYRLAQRVYEEADLSGNHKGPIHVEPYDAAAGTLTILAETPQGQTIGTLTLVYDDPRSTLGLPCETIFEKEHAGLQAPGRRFMEVTRLAIDRKFRGIRALLMDMIDWAYLISNPIRGFSDSLIEVHPRHASYYVNLFGSRQVGCSRGCPRVGGAEAVLLHLPGHAYSSCTHSTPWLRTPLRDRVDRVARELESHVPMDVEEAAYFGLLELVVACGR